MSESEIRKIGASITNDEFEVNADLSQIFSWSLGCSIIVEDTNADIQEIKTNDICLSGIVYIEELTVDINRVVFSNGLNVDFGITELDVNFGVGGVGGIGGAIIDEIGELKDSLKDVNDALVGINQESVNIKATINGIQSTVNDIGTELVNKASVESVTEIGASITEIQNNQYEQSVKLDVLGTEISTKASSESVTKIADVLVITNQTLAEQTTKVNDIGVQITTKAEASQVTEIEEGLKAASDSIAEQSTKVTALESQISTKAETETVTQLGESINIVSENVAEQIIRTDGIEASIENLVTNEVFNAATGEIESSITSVEQRTESIETTIKSQGGEITSIKENVNGLSIGIGNLESDLDSLRNQMDGVTESFFYAYSPTNDNEPAKTWIKQGKQAEHKGDTFTNTATEGDGAGKSWRWLQDNNGNWGWHPIADTDAQKALVLAAQAQATADGKVSIFYIQPSNYKEGDIWFVHNDEYSPYEKGEILTAIAGGTIFSISDWESKTRYTEAVKDLDKTMNTTFKDGVLDEAERLTIIEGVTALTNEKSAVDARYNITIFNSDFTDETLKNEYKATKATYDSAYNNLVGIVEQIAGAKVEGLKDLFDSYTTASENYTEAYSAHNEKETQVTDALMGRLNSASRYLDNITNDGILTPIEKEQLFEIYRNIAKEYDATRSNALNYKVWKYSNDGVTEESGLNGGEGRYESYVAFKNAYTAIANVFSSSMWGFTKMDESTTLPEGYTTTLLKSYLDTYYEKYGILTESFSAITAAIEAAQKATEETLQGLTDNLRPEEMSTIVGKGVVLSTIIATKDGSGKLTAGINGSLDQNKGEKSIAAWFGGDVVDVELDTDKPNPASSVIRHDGTGYFAKGLFSWDGNTGINLGRGGININYDGSLDFGDDIRIGGTETLGSLLKIVSKLSSMWRLEDGVLKTNYDVLTNGQFAAATVGAEGGGSVGATYLSDLYDVSLGSLLSGDILSWNGSEWVNIKQSSLVPDLSAYASKSFVSDALEGYLPKSGGTLTGTLDLGTNEILSNGKNVLLSFSGYDTYLYGSQSIYLATPNLYRLNDGSLSRVLDSENYSSYALPLSGGTIEGHLVLGAEGSNTSQHLFKIYRNINGTQNRALLGILDSEDIELSYYSSTDGAYKRLVIGRSGLKIGDYTLYDIIHSGNIGSQGVNSATCLTMKTNNVAANDRGSLDYTNALYTGGWANSALGYASTYGTYIDLSGFSSWYHRLAFNTTGEIEHFMGINTTTLSKVGSLAYLSSNVASADYATSAGSANVIATTYSNQSINFSHNESKLRLISSTYGDAVANGFPKQYISGLSVITDYAGWQMVTYGSIGTPNPYFRSFGDDGRISEWKQLAFLDDNVAGAQRLVDANGSPTIYNSGATFYVGDTIYPTVDTHILGKEIVLRYGASATNGLILNTSGNVTIGDSDYAASSNRFFVHGGAISGDTWADAGQAILVSSNAYYLALTTNESGYSELQSGQRNVGAKPLVLQKKGGNVLIGTTYDYGSKLCVEGGVQATATAVPSFTLRVRGEDNYHFAQLQALLHDDVFGTIHFFPSTDLITSRPTQFNNTINLNAQAVSLGTWQNPAMVVYADTGNVLVGTTTDSGYKCSIASSKATTLSLHRTSSGGGSFIDFFANNETENQWRVGHDYNVSGSSFVFNKFDSATEKTLMRINASGAYTLDVNGAAMAHRWLTSGENGVWKGSHYTGSLGDNGLAIVGTNVWIFGDASARNNLSVAGGFVAYGASTIDSTLSVIGKTTLYDTLTAQNGIVTNEITIGGIKLDVYNGALRVNGDIFSTGQFAASVAGEATGGSNIVLDYASIVNALGYTPANNNNLAHVAFTGSYTDLSNKPTSLPASDVYSWAKASVKPTYSWSEIQSRPDVYTKQEVDDKLSDIEGGEGCNCDDSTSGLGDTIYLYEINWSSYDVPNGVNCVVVDEDAELDFSSAIPLDPSRPCIMYLVKTGSYTLEVNSSSNITSVDSYGGLSSRFSVDGYTGMMLVWNTEDRKWHAYIQKM